MIEEFVISVTTTGGAGVSGGNATSDWGAESGWSVNGLLLAVYIPTGAASTADWVFSDSVSGIALFTLANYNTVGWYSPLIPGVAAATGVAISGAGVLVPLCNQVTLTISQSNNGTYPVRLRIERDRG